jgi:hypothetical protein
MGGKKAEKVVNLSPVCRTDIQDFLESLGGPFILD